MIEKAKKNQLDDADAQEPYIPEPIARGYTPEFGRRFSGVIDRIGRLKKAAKFVGYKTEQLAKWRDGKARPPWHAVVELADEAGVNLDWLATGKGPVNQATAAGAPLNEKMMGQVILQCEKYLARNGYVGTPEQKATLFMAIYRLLKADNPEGIAEPAIEPYADLIDLALRPPDD